MIESFGNKVAFDLFHHGHTKALPRQYWRRAIDIHKLSGWRITFRFRHQSFWDVKIENYH